MQPFADGNDSFCGKACVEAKNLQLLHAHADLVAACEGQDPPQPPDLFPLRRREGEEAEEAAAA